MLFELFLKVFFVTFVKASERLKCTLEEWSHVSKSSKFDNLSLDIVDSLTEGEIEQILEEICGLRHIEDRFERLVKSLFRLNLI